MDRTIVYVMLVMKVMVSVVVMIRTSVLKGKLTVYAVYFNFSTFQVNYNARTAHDLILHL